MWDPFADSRDRFIGHIDQYTKCALEHPNAKHSYVYDKALEISDEPPLFLVLARDPDEDAELCFVEHLETLVISMMDLCHSKDAPSLQIARGAQHPSLHSARKHEKLEGLNRLVPVKQNCRRTSETIECRNCGLSVDSRSYRSHLDEEGDLRSIHIYQICDDELKSAATLLNHVRTHDLGRPFVCPTCGKGFRTKMILDQHKRLHLENRGNVCDICGEILPTNDEWKMHVRAHNPNSVAHKCGTCGKELLTPSALANHELIHTGEKPHKCGHEGCPKSFREKSTLSAHELTHTDEKRFKCPAVGCLTAFRTNRDLSEHQVRCHSDERPYAYDVKGCKSIRYKYKGDLRKHAKKHKTCAHCNEVIVSTDRRTIDKHIKLCRTTAAFHANFDKRVVERDARELEAEERGKATKERKLDNDE